jgi:hypothetical protein
VGFLLLRRRLMSSRQNQKSIVTDAIIKEIIEALNNLKYGHVQITVHNSRIVQIDKTEKTRFDEIWLTENGGGI